MFFPQEIYITEIFFLMHIEILQYFLKQTTYKMRGWIKAYMSHMQQ